MRFLKKTNVNSWFYLALAQIMVACNIVCTKRLLPETPLLIILTIRFSVSSMLLFSLDIFAAKQIRYIKLLRNLTVKDWFFIFLQAITAGVLFNLLMAKGLECTSANKAGIIASTLPAIIGIFSFLFLKEKFSLKKKVSLLLATVGLFVVSFNQTNVQHESSTFVGDLIIFLSLIPEAGYYVLTKLYDIKTPIFFLSGLLNLINVIILIPITLLQSNFVQISFTSGFFLVLISISSALFYVFWYKGSRESDATECSLATSIMPIVVLFLSWVTLNEVVSFPQIIGVFFVMLSILTAFTQNTENLFRGKTI